MLSQILVYVVVVVLAPLNAYPHGPPLDSCHDLYPSGHNADAQTTGPIVTISVNKTDGSKATEYNINENLTVTVETVGASAYFEGLFVQARRAVCDDNQTHPYGTFSHEPNSAFLKTLDCNGLKDSAICHKDHTHQTKQTFYWIAPSQKVGHIYFLATVVKNTRTFWTGVASSFVMDNADSSSPQTCSVRKTNTAEVKSPVVVVVVLGLCMALANVI